jgi:hypothetical protein
MKHSKTANIIGSIGVACSLPFWIWFLGAIIIPLDRRPNWFNAILGHFSIMGGFLLLGLVLTLLAVRLGSRWWLVGILLPVFTLVFLWYFLAHLVI